MSLPLSYLDIRGVTPDDHQIQAVLIACDGQVHDLAHPRYTPLTISAFDDVYNSSSRSTSSISSVSAFLGVPLTARKLPMDISWRLDWRNPGAAALYRNCDIGATLNPAQNRFGSIPDKWSISTGPVVVARLDQKPLHELHMAAISAFITTEMDMLFEECMEAEQIWRDQYRFAVGEMEDDLLDSALWHIFERRRHVLSAATPNAFEIFWERYKAQRVRGRPKLLAPWHELTTKQKKELQFLEMDEIEPRPEWAEVPSPLNV